MYIAYCDLLINRSGINVTNYLMDQYFRMPDGKSVYEVEQEKQLDMTSRLMQ